MLLSSVWGGRILFCKRWCHVFLSTSQTLATFEWWLFMNVGSNVNHTKHTLLNCLFIMIVICFTIIKVIGKKNQNEVFSLISLLILELYFKRNRIINSYMNRFLSCSFSDQVKSGRTNVQPDVSNTHAHTHFTSHVSQKYCSLYWHEFANNCYSGGEVAYNMHWEF